MPKLGRGFLGFRGILFQGFEAFQGFSLFCLGCLGFRVVHFVFLGFRCESGERADHRHGLCQGSSEAPLCHVLRGGRLQLGGSSILNPKP